MSMTPDRTEDLRDVHRRIRNMLASFRASTWSESSRVQSR
jgi:hypothetical protein